MTAAPHWDALVVAGGRASRLGGIDKTALIWHGHSLLDGVLAAVAGAGRVCVVGSDAHLPAEIVRAVEQPRWGGPAAAIVAGLQALAQTGTETGTGAGDWVVVLAGDLVHPDEAVPDLLSTLAALVAAGEQADGLISVDADGRRQPLLAVYRRAALSAASIAVGPPENLSVKSLIGGLNLVELRLADDASDDVDTPHDAARLGITLPAPAQPAATPPASPPTTPAG